MGSQPDAREGTTPPEVQNLDLENAADEAGCTLRLNLPDEGNTHLEPGAKAPNYRTNPPTSGDHVSPCSCRPTAPTLRRPS